jgi:hypothetical protein
MNNKVIVGTLVGAILLFGWQTLSWTSLGIHEEALKFSANQDSIIQFLEKNISTPGQYLIPTVPPGSSESEIEAQSKIWEGKPWAIITFHDYRKIDMFTPVLKGRLIALLSVLMVNLVIRQLRKTKFLPVFATTLSFGLVSFFFVWYNNNIWFSTPWSVLWGELVDSVMGWSLCGAWLGLWYGRK